MAPIPNLKLNNVFLFCFAVKIMQIIPKNTVRTLGLHTTRQLWRWEVQVMSLLKQSDAMENNGITALNSEGIIHSKNNHFKSHRFAESEILPGQLLSITKSV